MTREVPAWVRWLALALLVLAAFCAGRFSAPIETEERVEVRLQVREKVVEKRVEVAAHVEAKIVYRDRLVTPDGTVRERELEHSGSETVAASATERVEVREVEKLVEVVRRVEVRPSWRVSLTAGASLQPPAVELAGPLVVGLEVDRRIVGGLSAGLWASTSGAGGVALSFDF